MQTPRRRGTWWPGDHGRTASPIPSFLLGPLFLTVALRRQAEWRSDVPALAGVVVVLTLSVVAFAAVAAARDLAGLAERVVLVLLFARPPLVGRRLVELRSPEPLAAPAKEAP